MAEQSPRDQNFVPAALFESSTQAGVVQAGQINTSTGRIRVDIAGGGSVTDVSVVTANGFAGSVATSTTTPAITLSATITGILSGNGTAISAASTTGSGAVVLATSPTLVTPALGVATATSLAIGGATLGTNGLAVTGHVLIEGVTSTGATGTGAFVFATTPTLVTPVLGVATATSINKVTITAPASSATLTLIDSTTVTGPASSGTIMTLGNVETVTGAKTMSSVVLPDQGTIRLTTPTTDLKATGFTTSDYVSGYSSTAIGDLVYLDSSGKWQKTDANTLLLYNGLLGIALTVSAADAACTVALPGSFIYSTTGFPTWTIGLPIYMSETAGAMTHTAPTTTDSATRVVGWGVHADKMYFYPSQDYITHI